MAVDLRLPGANGVDVPQRAHEWHPAAARAVLVAMDRYHTRISFEELGTLRSALALGRMYFWIMKEWDDSNNLAHTVGGAQTYPDRAA